jgi:hypothetical protein
MRSKEGDVLTIKQMEEAGISMPEYEETEIDAGDRKIPVVKQKEATNEGIIEFPKKKPEEERKAA